MIPLDYREHRSLLPCVYTYNTLAQNFNQYKFNVAASALQPEIRLHAKYPSSQTPDQSRWTKNYFGRYQKVCSCQPGRCTVKSYFTFKDVAATLKGYKITTPEWKCRVRGFICNRTSYWIICLRFQNNLSNSIGITAFKACPWKTWIFQNAFKMVKW